MPRNRGRGWYNDKPQHRLAGRGIPTKADGERLDKMKSKIGGVYDSQIKDNFTKLVDAIKRKDPEGIEKHLDYMEDKVYEWNEEGKITDSKKDRALIIMGNIRDTKDKLLNDEDVEVIGDDFVKKEDLYWLAGELMVVLGIKGIEMAGLIG